MTDRFLFFQHRGTNAFQLPLDGGSTTIGRGRECAVCLPDPDCHLSRVHVDVRVNPAGVYVVDRSANGAFLGGARLVRGAPKRWTPGKSLQLPGWRATLVTAGSVRDEQTDDHAWAPSGSRPPIRDGLHGLLGVSPAMRTLFQAVRRIARHDVPVLIRGETGTGKELVARAIHAESRRAGRSFVAVNCGAIPAGTASSHLFGHVRGAFTGARAAAIGAFREADGGTLFLDELGELPPPLQAAILRAIELREVVPVGSAQPEKVDFRLLAATHCDLETMVAEGRFRADLLYRLEVANLRVPPLRERPEDIELLARHFVRSLAFGPATSLDPATLALLHEHSWPGNVRELRNAALRAVLTANGGLVLPRHVEFSSALPRPTNTLDVAPPIEPPRRGASLREELVRALERHDGNRKAAAEDLGIARSTLYERMRRFGLS